MKQSTNKLNLALKQLKAANFPIDLNKNIKTEMKENENVLNYRLKPKQEEKAK